MNFFSLVGSIIEKLFMAAGAFIGSQIPQFIQQYTQHLAGRIAALQNLVLQLEKMANMSQKTLYEYIQKFKDSIDPDFAQQGLFMEGIVSKNNYLQDVLVQLNQSPFWIKPFNFLKNFESEIGEKTYQMFEPGLTLNIEGICYGVIGLILGWLLYQMLRYTLSKLFIKIKKIFYFS